MLKVNSQPTTNEYEFAAVEIVDRITHRTWYLTFFSSILKLTKKKAFPQSHRRVLDTSNFKCEKIAQKKLVFFGRWNFQVWIKKAPALIYVCTAVETNFPLGLWHNFLKDLNKINDFKENLTTYLNLNIRNN